MVEFYSSLSGVEKLYLFCALIGGVLLFIRTIMLVIGAGFGADADMEGDLEMEGDFDIEGDLEMEELSEIEMEEEFEPSEASFRMFTLQGLMGFFMMFGLIGLTLTQQLQLNDFWSLLGGLAAGVFTMWLVSRLFIGVQKLQESGNIDYRNAIGQEGSVYLTIPKGGTGKVQIIIQGGLRICEASSNFEKTIKTGANVRVVDVANGNILVVEETLKK